MKEATMLTSLPLDKIVPGATMPVAMIQGSQYLAVRDVIMHAC